MVVVGVYMCGVEEEGREVAGRGRGLCWFGVGGVGRVSWWGRCATGPVGEAQLMRVIGAGACDGLHT